MKDDEIEDMKYKSLLIEIEEIKHDLNNISNICMELIADYMRRKAGIK